MIFDNENLHNTQLKIADGYNFKNAWSYLLFFNIIHSVFQIVNLFIAS